MDNNVFFGLPIEDQNQYFGKTFFQVLFDGTYKWGFCNSFILRNTAKFNFDSDAKLINIDLRRNLPNFEFPATGLYNLGKSTVYFQKIPRRQAKKGICRESARLKHFSSIFLEQRGVVVPFDKEPWKTKTIRDLFENTEDFSLANSFTIFKKRKPISFALNRNFAISLGITSKFLNLWYKQLLVGELPSPREIILLPGCMFKQEVIDHFQQEHVNIITENQ